MTNSLVRGGGLEHGLTDYYEISVVFDCTVNVSSHVGQSVGWVGRTELLLWPHH